jgi:predicted transcriptional regulator
MPKKLPFDDQELISEYNSGVHLSDIALKRNVSTDCIRYRLKQNGMKKLIPKKRLIG